MTTRLERIEESLKREQHRQDIRKLKRAVEYFDMGLAVLKDGFHDKDYTSAASGIVAGMKEELVFVRKVIEEN